MYRVNIVHKSVFRETLYGSIVDEKCDKKAVYNRELQKEKELDEISEQNREIRKHNEEITRRNEEVKRKRAETEKFIFDLFSYFGYSSDEAEKYLKENSRMLTLTKERIASTLAIYNIVDLDRKAFLEHPANIISRPDLYNLYRAVKDTTYSGEELTVRNIMFHATGYKRDEADDIFRIKLNAFYKNYINKVETKQETLSIK